MWHTLNLKQLPWFHRCSLKAIRVSLLNWEFTIWCFSTQQTIQKHHTWRTKREGSRRFFFLQSGGWNNKRQQSKRHHSVRGVAKWGAAHPAGRERWSHGWRMAYRAQGRVGCSASNTGGGIQLKERERSIMKRKTMWFVVSKPWKFSPVHTHLARFSRCGCSS